ncbi:MAG: cell division protein FtsA [Chloroflexi bacterium]|nr:cell division protein FtsA [Chloroflexota bacterium]
MMAQRDDRLFFALDVGTSKVAALVARAGEEGEPLTVVATAMEPARGMHEGVVVDVPALTQVIRRVVQRINRSSPLPMDHAYVTFSGARVQSQNHRGAVGVSHGVVDKTDIARAEEAAKAIAIPHNREIVHIIRRNFRLDDHPVGWPEGMYGYRLEAEVHIISAEKTALLNLRQAVESAGVAVDGFVLGGLAASEAVLSQQERDVGAVVVDIGAGTTDVLIYSGGEIWHTAVLPMGGEQLTRDLAFGLNLPLSEAERVKREHGAAWWPEEAQVLKEERVFVKPFGQNRSVAITRYDLVRILGPRVEQMLQAVAQTVREAQPPTQLAAGLILTGGTALLPGVREMAARILRLPSRVARPEGVRSLPEAWRSPAFAAAVGTVRLARLYWSGEDWGASWTPPIGPWWRRVLNFLRDLLP